MGCTCNNKRCNGDCFVTRQIRVNSGLGRAGGIGEDTLDDVSQRGNVTTVSLVAKPAIFDYELATLGQVKEYSQSEGFKYIEQEENGDVIIVGSSMQKVVISQDAVINANVNSAGQRGVLILKVNDDGGYKYSFAEGNIGNTILNTLPRAQTRLYWERYDDLVRWTSDIIMEGIKPTPIPVFAIDDYYDTLEVFSSYADSEILLSTDNGPFLPYPGKFNIGAVDRPAGYWKAKVKSLEPSRLESYIAYSLPTHSVKVGFPFVLPLTLS